MARNASPRVKGDYEIISPEKRAEPLRVKRHHHVESHQRHNERIEDGVCGGQRVLGAFPVLGSARMSLPYNSDIALDGMVGEQKRRESQVQAARCPRVQRKRAYSARALFALPGGAPTRRHPPSEEKRP